MSQPTYLLYTDHVDAVKARLYVEVGEVFVVPRAGERITVDETAYTVKEVLWNVYTGQKERSVGMTYPQQCATVVLK